MASNFPTSKDDNTSLPVESGTTPLSTNHIENHQNSRDAIKALQDKVGIDASTDQNSHDFKLSNVTGSDKAVSLTGEETMTNKTMTSPKINVGSDVAGDIYKRDGSGNFVRIPIGNANELFGVNGAGTDVQYLPVAGVTTDEKDALAGTAGTPDASNPFITLNTLTGFITMWGGSSAPTGWLLCEGQAVSRATYATLFSIIGETYGAGDGSTTFNLPNLKGRVPVGFDSAQTEFDALGETGGAKTHTLSIDEMPAHTHPSEDYSVNSASTGDFNAAYGQSASRATGSVPSQGGGQAHNNIQPYITLNFIIKT